jgi:DNA-directed RNA polymerase subunit H (RpoH/RPB5)
MDFENIYKSRKNILNMLKLRSFDISKYENQSKEELNILFINHHSTKKILAEMESLDIFIEGKDNNILVKYILIDKYRKNALEKLNDTIYENLLEYKDTCIYITKDNIIKDKDTYRDSTLKKYIDKIFEINKQFIQIFGLNSLLYDITKHDLTPECRILNDKEKETLLNKYSIVENDLPNILVNDALGSIYGVKVGDIIEETSPSATAGISKFYRLCIP